MWIGPVAQCVTHSPYLSAQVCMANSPAARPAFADVERSCRAMAALVDGGQLEAGLPFSCYKRDNGEACLRKHPTF